MPTVKPSLRVSDVYEASPDPKPMPTERAPWRPPIDVPTEDDEPGVGIEITITLTIGLLLFIINGAAFLNLAWKKRNAQKQFRRNLEVIYTFFDIFLTIF